MSTHLKLTPQMLLVVLEVKKQTGILTVKDVETGGNPHAKPYGQKYHPTIKVRGDGTPVRDENSQHERVIQMWHPGSTVWPGGIPVGMTLRHKRKNLQGFGMDEDFKLEGGQSDLCWDEEERLAAAAFGKTWWTEEMRAADEREKEALRAKRVLADLDPTSALAKALAPLLIAAAQGKLGDLAPAAGVAPASPAHEDPAVPIVTQEAGSTAESESFVLPPEYANVDLRTREGRALKARLEREALEAVGK